jgi:hypothetical protein
MKTKEARTSAQIVSDTPVEPLPPVPVELPPIDPLPDRLAKRLSCSGTTDRSVAVQAEQKDSADAWHDCWRFARAKAEAIKDMLIESNRLKTEAATAVFVARDKLGHVRDQIVRRAGLRASEIEAETKLASAQKTMANRASLKLSDAELVRNNMEALHLPEQVAEIKREIVTITDDIERTAGDAGIDLPKLITVMVEDARRPAPGRNDPSAPHIVSFHNRNLLA